jgi:hypothetical protein
MRKSLFAVLVVFALVASVEAAPFQKGVYVASWRSTEYSSPTAKRSIQALEDTGTEWLAVVSPNFLEDKHSTAIYAEGNDRNSGVDKSAPTDADLEAVIGAAHQQGLKVMLVPQIKVLGPDQWKGEIEFKTEGKWAEWFDAYGAFVLRHAKLAQRLGVEQFSMGNELRNTSHREAEWRELIRQVRGVFSRRLTYCAHHDEVYRIAWWDDLDAIGIDAYWNLVNTTQPSVADIERAWQPHAKKLEELARRFGKQIIFTEVGFRSADGTAEKPWYYDPTGSQVDVDEQADAYEATFRAFFNEPWVGGFYWWAWDIDGENGISDTGYSPQGKPAEDVITEWYGGRREPEGFGWIYRDGFESGWEGQRWSASMDASGAGGRYGSRALRVSAQGLGGIAFDHAGIDASRHGALELYLQGAEDLQLELIVESSAGEFTVDVGSHVKGRLSRQRWTRVVLPLEALPTVLGPVRISLQDFSGRGATFAVDEVRLIEGQPKPEGPSPFEALSKLFEQIVRALGLGSDAAAVASAASEPPAAIQSEGILGALARGR